MLSNTKKTFHNFLTNTRRLIWGLLLTYTSITTLHAQDTAKTTSVKWDLQTCLDYAKQNNLQLNTLRNQKRTSEQEYLLSKSAILPNLYGTATQYAGHSNLLNIYTNNRYQSTVCAIRQLWYNVLVDPVPGRLPEKRHPAKKPLGRVG